MTIKHRARSYALGAIALSAILLASLILVFQARPSAAKAATTFSTNWYNAAPYVMPLANNPPSLTTVMSGSGVKAFTLAFVVADSGCTPAWETDAGLTDVSADTQMGPIINAIRAAGGDVVVSFGGYGGTKLGQTCGTPQATAAAEQAVINKYSLKALDFDLEEPEYENATAINNELGAAQILQASNSGLYESITIPGTTSGTGYFGQQLLNNAKTLGYTPDNYAIMPFDGGFSGASSQISALQSFNTILVNTFGWTSAAAYAREGISSMNGRTDSGEYFYQADFQSVLTFVQNNHLGRFTYWSVNRDRQCTPPDNNGVLSGTCSSVAQSDWDFTKIIATFGGATPPPPITPTPTTSGGGQCSGVAAWSSTAVYVGGNQVTYNGSLWQAKWWTQGDTPGGSVGVWTLIGSCGTGSTPTPTPTTGTTPTPTPTTGTTPTPTPTMGTTPTATSTGGNLVSNGGFETGTLSSWTCNSGDAVVSTPVHSGSHAGQLTPSSSTTGECDQTITVQANHTYTLTAYVDGSYAYLGVTGGSSTWTSSSSYTKLNVTFTTTASQTSITIFVHGWYGQGNVFVDDVSLS
ncbi:MAG TPA: carbohydrate binding domain-containing protein [Ktedonobacteraceae bacterium]